MNLKRLKALYPDDLEIQALAESKDREDMLDVIKDILLLKKQELSGKGIDIIRGEDGKTPEKGVDYFTPEDIEEVKEGIREEVTPVKGVDYFDGKDGESVVGPAGPRGVPGKDGIGIKGDRGEQGEKGDKGDSGESADPASVIEEIKNLEGEAATDFSKKVGGKIDISHIRNAQTFMYKGTRYDIAELMHGAGSGGGSTIELETNGVPNGDQTLLNLVEGDNVTISDDGNGNITFDVTATTTNPAPPDTSVQFNDGGSFGGANWLYTQPDASTIQFQPASPSLPSVGPIETFTISNGGSNYQVSDVVQVLQAGGTFAQLVVTTVDGGGAVLTVEIVSGGIGYSLGSATTGAGITSAIPNNGGSGYSAGNLLSVAGGAGTAVLSVDSVDGGGAITALSVNTGGSEYSNATNVVLSGGDGTGATADITVLEGGNGLTINITDLVLAVNGIGVNIFSGDTSGESSQAGPLLLKSGDALGNNSNGATLTLLTGNGLGTQSAGDGNLFIGDSGETGNGGNWNIGAGSGGATSGSGGSISLTAGYAQGGDSDGGALTLTAGESTGIGNPGVLSLNTGYNSGGAPYALFNSGNKLIRFAFDNISGGRMDLLPVESGGILLNSGAGTNALLDTSLLTSSDKTYQFPDQSGVLALVSDIPTATTFVDNEVVSGSGTSFTLANTPILGSEHIYGNGARLTPTVDYSISSATLTMVNSFVAGTVLADYRM